MNTKASIETEQSSTEDDQVVASAEPTGDQSPDDGVNPSSPDGTPPDVNTADEPQSMLDAVEQALGTPSDPEGAEAEPGTDGEDDGEPKGEADGKGEDDQDFLKSDPTDEEVKDYSKKAQTRIRDLIEQRNEAAARAERVEPILNFLDTNDIPQQDLGVILDLTARLRHGDFAGFLQGVQPYVELARQYTGQKLPNDLQQKVREGYISPELAKELAQRRAGETVARSQSQSREAQLQRQAVQSRAESIRQTVTNWEAQTRARDPDYDLKAEVVRRTAQALMQEKGVPQTPQQAVEYVQEAYNEVNEQMKRLRPAPKVTGPRPNATSSARGSSKPASEPSSMFEAAMQGLESHRTGR